MFAQATTTVTVARGTTIDGFGDVVDTGATVLTDVPASIIQASKIVKVHADGRAQRVRIYTGRVRADVDIRAGDQLTDADGNLYVVDDAFVQPSPFATHDLRLDLRRVPTA